MTLCATPPSSGYRPDAHSPAPSAPSSIYRVAIVDDDPAFTAALAALVDISEGLMIAGTAANVSDALDMLSKTSVDLALIDVKMPKGGGVAIVNELATAGCMPPVVLMSTGPRPNGVARHIRFVDKADLDGPSLRAWASTPPR